MHLKEYIFVYLFYAFGIIKNKFQLFQGLIPKTESRMPNLYFKRVLNDKILVICTPALPVRGQCSSLIAYFFYWMLPWGLEEPRRAKRSGLPKCEDLHNDKIFYSHNSKFEATVFLQFGAPELELGPNMLSLFLSVS